MFITSQLSSEENSEVEKTPLPCDVNAAYRPFLFVRFFLVMKRENDIICKRNRLVSVLDSIQWAAQATGTYLLHVFVLDKALKERINRLIEPTMYKCILTDFTISKKKKSYHGTVGHFDEVVFGAGNQWLGGGRRSRRGRCWQRHKSSHLKQKKRNE